MSEDRVVIGISYIESIPRELIDPYLHEIDDERIEFVEERRADTQFFASVEWFIPTAVFLYLSKGYFDGFLQAAGSDHYESLKKVIPAWFARLSRIRVSYLSSASKKLRDDNPFTGAMSLIAERDKNRTFKLMFRTQADAAEIGQSIIAFLEFLRHFHSGIPLSNLIADYEPPETIEHQCLVYFDIEAQKMRILNPRNREARELIG